MEQLHPMMKYGNLIEVYNNSLYWPDIYGEGVIPYSNQPYMLRSCDLYYESGSNVFFLPNLIYLTPILYDLNDPNFHGLANIWPQFSWDFNLYKFSPV